MLERATAEGRLSPDFDIRVGVALLVGPMLYSWMATMAGATLPDDLSVRVSQSFWRAHGIAPRVRTAATSHGEALARDF